MQVGAAEQAGSNEAVFARVYAQVSTGRPLGRVVCLVRPYVSTMARVRFLDGVLEVRLNPLVADAPEPVREALAWVLLSKMFRRRVEARHAIAYRRYMNRREVRATHDKLQRVRGRKYISGPRGEVHDLDALFDSLAERYFPFPPQKPQLGWSRSRSRSLLGHFDAAHNAIILSRVLDQATVPTLAVEYVLYHEMLHLRHAVDHSGVRRRVHTKEFRRDEKLFEGLAEAREHLKRL